MKPLKILKNVTTVGVWTLASRVLGLIRDVIFFTIIGVGPVLDAFFVAFRLPNMFRRFFAEGAFNASFVPMFSKRLETNDNPNYFLSQSFNILAFILIFFTILCILCMPALIWLTAGGFYQDARFDLAVDYGRIIFPYILFVSLSSVLSGALNSKGFFAASAAAPILLNLTIITAVTTAWYFNLEIAYYLVWSIPLAGILQLFLLWRAAKTAGLVIKLSRPCISPEIKNLFAIAAPAAMANGVVQINILVGQVVASFYAGAVSWLYGADRLYQLPLGVVGVAVGIVLLPELARRLQTKDIEGARTAFSGASEIVFFLSFPATAALCLIPLPITSALFEHGMTDREDVKAIALATAIYGLGLPAFMIQKVLQPLYFADGDTKTPFKFALVTMVVNALLSIGLIPWLGWISPAVATTFSAWVMVILLFKGAQIYKDIIKFETHNLVRLRVISISSVVMGGVLWLINFFLIDLVETTIQRILYCGFLVFFGTILYLLLVQTNGAFSLKMIKKVFKKN